MLVQFKSEAHEKVFTDVLSGLQSIGYTEGMLARDYEFGDWFSALRETRTAPAAAFGASPPSYENACFSILIPNGVQGQELIFSNRALGAPFALEVHQDRVIHWKVGTSLEATHRIAEYSPSWLDNVFIDNASKWESKSILRAKNISFTSGPTQLDFIDLGLLPALESEIRTKLDKLLTAALSDGVAAAEANGSSIEYSSLFRSLFLLLATKVFHDRGMPGFEKLDGVPKTIQLAARHLGYRQLPILNFGPSFEAMTDHIWSGLNFQNLSVETLAFIYENTLISHEARQVFGTHGTPMTLARYLVHKLPLEGVPLNERIFVEPCSGHGVFLVAALQRLKEDPRIAQLSASEQHSYLVSMLHGFEIDSFALEVSRLCLTLADFPNPNGWNLTQSDVFNSKKLSKQLQNARFLVGNPPFEDFTEKERDRYNPLRSVHKPAEILLRALDRSPNLRAIAFVLPRPFLDGSTYREVRKRIADRFSLIEVTALPDKVFPHSDVECCLLLALHPGNRDRVLVSSSSVRDLDWAEYRRSFSVSSRSVGALTKEDAAERLSIGSLHDIWRRLEGYPRLGEHKIHRGVEWTAPFNAIEYISSKPKPGFKRGLHNASSQPFLPYLPPEHVPYLSFLENNRRGNAFQLDWESDKVFVNAARRSRGPWCIVAMVDEKGLACTQNFHAIWPKEPWSSRTLAAVLNSPIANLFVADRENKRHVRRSTLANMPLPVLDRDEFKTLDKLVSSLIHLGDTDVDNNSRQIAAGVHIRQIDEIVGKGYGLTFEEQMRIAALMDNYQRPTLWPLEDCHHVHYAVHKSHNSCDADRVTEDIAERYHRLLDTVIAKAPSPEQTTELELLGRELDEIEDAHPDERSVQTRALLSFHDKLSRLEFIAKALDLSDDDNN